MNIESFKPKIALSAALNQTISRVLKMEVAPARTAVLQPLVDYIKQKAEVKTTANLLFVCTHNSRRSTMAQIWAQTAANYFGISANCLSAGTEVTAFNPRAVAALRDCGFEINTVENSENPVYEVRTSSHSEPIRAFSKLYGDGENQHPQLAAIMTCGNADENCPFIAGSEVRLAVRYDDPKAFDDTPEETEKYRERALQIASEMFFVFRAVKEYGT